MLQLEFIGYHHERNGDLFTMTNEYGLAARVYVDSVGQTWVDIRRIPEGGSFHTDRVESYRAFDGALAARRDLQQRGYGHLRHAVGNACEREDGNWSAS